jgi:type I restriction enzyme S subunit
MTPELLLTHFERVTDTPEAMPSLRSFIIDLAVRGKLVPQDSKDEPAVELLKRIHAKKAQLIANGSIREEQRTQFIGVDEPPFHVPTGWSWARLSALSSRIHYGFTASANPSIKAVRLLRITDIQNNSVDWDAVPGCEISASEADQYRLGEGDILIARTGGTIGKTFLVRHVPVAAVFASYLIRVQGSSEMYDQYLKLFLESPAYWKQLRDGTRGGGQPNVNGQTLGRMKVSVPPAAEQRRIVEKVSEVLELCNRLEEQLLIVKTEKGRLLEAILQRTLSDSESHTVQNEAACG